MYSVSSLFMSICSRRLNFVILSMRICYSFSMRSSVSAMDGDFSPNMAIEKLVEMGFEYLLAKKAVETVGPSVNNAADYLLSGNCRSSHVASTSSKCSTSKGRVLGKRALSSSHPKGQTRQLSIFDHFQSKSRTIKSEVNAATDKQLSGSKVSLHQSNLMEGQNRVCHSVRCDIENPEELEIGPDWEDRVNILLQKKFGYSSLKAFQKEALEIWVAHQDCLVLAATGSG